MKKYKLDDILTQMAKDENFPIELSMECADIALEFSEMEKLMIEWSKASLKERDKIQNKMEKLIEEIHLSNGFGEF